MKSLLSVNKQWNRLMEIIGTPIMVFISLSWCISTFGTNSLAIGICFTVAVLLVSINFWLALVEAILGLIILLSFSRELFLIPIKLPFLAQPFTWWNQQTACAGTATIIFVMFIVKIVVTISSKGNEN